MSLPFYLLNIPDALYIVVSVLLEKTLYSRLYFHFTSEKIGAQEVK